MQILLDAFSSNPWYGVATALVALCSAIAAATPTPAAGTTLAKVYSIIDFLALNFGKAKQK
jgi:hypothetical protein